MKKPRKCWRCTTRDLVAACNLLKHFHQHHTANKITMLTSADEEVDIFIASDPDSRQRIRAIEEFESQELFDKRRMQ